MHIPKILINKIISKKLLFSVFIFLVCPAYKILLLFSKGAVDQAGHDAIAVAAQATKDALDAGDFVGATNEWGYTEGVIWDVAHFIDFYNVLTKIPSVSRPGLGRSVPKPGSKATEDELLDALMTGPVAEALGINITWGAQSGMVFATLSGDFMKPCTAIVEQLLDNTDVKVAVYNGQLDLIVDTPGTVIWVDNLQWSGTPQWAVAERTALAVDGWNEGYVKRVGDLVLYWVNRAGHMVRFYFLINGI